MRVLPRGARNPAERGPGIDARAAAVLDFWFGPPPWRSRKAWFAKDAGFDAAIREAFGELHEEAARGGLAGWERSATEALALVLVLDQFSRNLYRGDARAFAQDARALAVAASMVERGWDLERAPLERQFIYLPFEHAESLAMQDRSAELFGALEAFEETRGLLAWAEKHRVIVRRFGRFPHRNAALGRPTTPEERDFLLQPGSGF